MIYNVVVLRFLFVEEHEGGLALRTFEDLFQTTIVPLVPWPTRPEPEDPGKSGQNLGPIFDFQAVYRQLAEPVRRFLRLPQALVLPDSSIEVPPPLLLPSGTQVTIRLMPSRWGYPWLLLESRGGPDPLLQPAPSED